MEAENYLLCVDNMKKSFGITKALKGVQLQLKSGEILGLIGENGSGKSTLTSIIAGIQPADSGGILFHGEPYSIQNSVEANEKGICMILQEKATFDNLSVAHNVFIGNEKEFCKHGILNNKLIFEKAREVLKKIGVTEIDVKDKIKNRSFEDGKLVELARAANLNPQILIVDETTTALSQNGRDILYTMMENMKKEGKSVIFISHDIDEMMSKCDRLSILRDGDYIGTLEKEEYSPEKIKSLMVGRTITDNYYREDTKSSYGDEIVLKAENITTSNLKDVSFELHKGEILGFGGLADSGMHDIGKAAFGAIHIKKGKVVDGQNEQIYSPSVAMKKKIAYIGKNRDQESLFVNSPIRDNVALPSYKIIAKNTFVSPTKERKFVEEWTTKLDVKMQNIDQYVSELSGGNKQKVAIAKWLGFGADIFILDCPTRGIDIGVKASIYKLLTDLKNRGKSIILISEELPEVIGMCDRVVVLKNGQNSGIFVREDDLTENKLINYMV
ncbi:MAG TPA: sugar ABC transporter ATP-binding protein [Clostridiales bacterium]|nr:sugar ABC transporter ATP-binding protein [Clostridiales bacterium]